MATSIGQAIRESVNLLSRRDRFLIFVVIFAQTFLALFDLIGIALIGAVVALGSANISGKTIPVFQKIIDEAGKINISTNELLLIMSASAGVLLIAKSLISFLIVKKTYAFLALRQALVAGSLIQELISRPILFIQQNTTQDIAMALTAGVNAATLGVIGSSIIVASELPVLIILGIGLSFYDLSVTIFTILFFGIIGVLIHRLLASQGKKLGHEVSRVEIESLEAVQEAIGSFKEIAVFGRQNFYIQKIKLLRWKASDAQGKLSVMNQSTKYIYEAMLIIGGGLLLSIELLTQELATAITIITVFLAAASRLMPSLLRLQTAGISIIYSAGLARPTLDLASSLMTTQNNRQPNISKPLSFSKEYDLNAGRDFNGEVELKQVEFTYPGVSSPAIKSFSVHLESGKSLALVGPTGAGKSTIADIVLGLIEPQKGDVLISGCEPKEIIALHPGSIAYVPQSTKVVRGNIRENVALGVPKEFTDDDKVWEALDSAQLGTFLREHRSGLETVVGENGFQLSGGQRQRLGLARALYSKPKLLILDEATSALDAETESLISQALTQLEGDVTTITIAHRLSTIRSCDLIIYLEQGKEIARGSFEELRTLSSSFNELAKLSGL